ncbi:hypothetical protein H696_00554 [Fonticula alba]|uniref:Uncharacterized protein n=1 Tax=Fonticula alba TaxID=691883 RepID=A0A058ZF81_FONAL|nr:hypothetical protein H696_00554 [Fonticula alba]KCV73004.1 hypothetical protein H696_00554 [Fonticula alba]|eukprot:XP_009492705.1 hypothetical protein H696_00554 [Fonticula alba]
MAASALSGLGQAISGSALSLVSNYVDPIGGVPLPNCPTDTTSLGHMSYPTVVFLNITMFFMCAVLVAVTIWKYNSVVVFNLNFRYPENNNTLWALFFGVVGLRAIIEAIRYSMDIVEDSSTLNMALFFTSLVLDGFGALALALTLGYQYHYRSGNTSPDSASGVFAGKNPSLGPSSYNDYAPVNNHHSDGQHPDYAPYAAAGPGDFSGQPSSGLMHQVSYLFRTYFLSWETLYFFLFVVFLVAAYLNVTFKNEPPYYWFFFGSCILLRMPALVLTYIITTSPHGLFATCRGGDSTVLYNSLGNGRGVGPTGRSAATSAAITDASFTPTTNAKILLVVGFLLTLFMTFPSSIWAELILPLSAPGGSPCIIFFASWLDILYSGAIVGVLCFFFFLRSEYLRNHEESVWRTISRIQDYMDFRRF